MPTPSDAPATVRPAGPTPTGIAGSGHDLRPLDAVASLSMLLFLVGFLRLEPVLLLPIVPPLVTVVGLWIWWRVRLRRHRRSPGLAVAIALLVFWLMMCSPALTNLGLVWIAGLALTIEGGVAAGLGFAAALGAISAGGHLWMGHGALRATIEGLGILLITSVGVAYAVALLRSDRLAAERADALRALERAYAEQRLRHGREQDLVLAEERSRVATALHDGLGHRLTAVGMRLDNSLLLRDRDPGRADAQVHQARRITGEALEEMRCVVRAMHPVATRAGDIAGSLRAVAASFSSTRLDVRLEQHGDSPIGEHEGLLLLRFAQEGLTNVVRHAHATAAALRLDLAADGLRLTVTDDGDGADPHDEAHGFGVRSLRERAEALGGTVTAERGATGGFVLTLELPQAAADEA